MKSDSPRFSAVLGNLAEANWVKQTERRWWPRFLFHYADVRNAAKILEDGYLYSRQFLSTHSALPISSGSNSVLSGTDEYIKNCVRLYFRPQTPTQFHTEGLRSADFLSTAKFPDAHCPVPIFFLFDAATILSLDNSRFSDRGLGIKDYRLLSTAAELAELDWRKIYHNGIIDWSNPSETDIVAKRNAEVIVPNQLDLSALRFIYCRSEAERETFLHLLPSPLYQKYKKVIVASTRSNLYFRRHTYVERARLSYENALLEFSPDTQSPGPFRLQVKLIVGSITARAQIENFTLENSNKLKISSDSKLYELQVTLDDHLIYANSFVESDGNEISI